MIASGNAHSVEEFLKIAFDYVELDFRQYLVIDENLYRPSEVNVLQGDASKAREKLAWEPEISFEEMIREMVDSDLDWYSQ